MSKLLRAVADDDKKLRRQSILQAAAELFAEDSRQLPSVISIAKACGLAKGTVYLYFKTKEGIFLALLSQYFQSWFEQGLQAMAVMQADGCTALKDQIPRLLTVLVDYLENNPEFMQLASMNHSIIEKNLDNDVAYQFKKELLDLSIQMGNAVEQLIPALPKGEGVLLLRRTYALTIGIWQLSDWPDAMVDAFGEDEFQVLRPKFADEARLAVMQLWIGAAQLG